MLGAPINYGRSDTGYDVADEVATGLLVPNASGGTMLIPGAERENPVPYIEEAFELKLKARELAAQMLETQNNQALVGLVAVPSSFANLDNLAESTQLGRYFGEAMYYEFNQRGFPVREYRLSGSIVMQDGTGELALTRNLPPAPAKQSWAALLVGTFQRDKAAVFINARLVRATDGMVLRTAQLVLPLNQLMTRMTTNPPKPAPPPKPPFAAGSLRIK
jgi:TolB-like protein